MLHLQSQKRFHFVCLAILVCQFIVSSNGYPLDIDVHLQVGEEEYFLALNTKLRQLLHHDDIDFATTATPHVTLYLTQFRNETIQEVIKTAREVASKFPPDCMVHLSETVVSGYYGMWNVKVTQCLQNMSDNMVIALVKFIEPNQPVPSWVFSLPEPQRLEKIKMIKEFGSPNVFNQFQAHVTLAYDEIEPMQPVFDALKLQPKIVRPPAVGVGRVGPHGTVLRNQNWATFPLPKSPFF